MNHSKLGSLNLKEKIGQMLFIGISGSEFDSKTEKLITELSPGGVCLFSRNIKDAEQVRLLIEEIHNHSQITPFISLDQEGGLVDRLRRLVTPMPSASEFKNKDDVRRFGSATASIIKELGFNMNFAPVIDVNTHERSKFSNGLQSRTFGNSVQDVIELAGVFLAELNNAGIVGCLKHFPGLGASEADSHNELPLINISKDELENVDLEPYRELMQVDNRNIIMIAHAAYPNIDLQEIDQNGRLLPSSLSGNFIYGLLRDSLKFDGLVITDDLEMGAIVNNYGIGEACKMAVKAGVDLLAVCAGEDSIHEGFNAILAAVQSGEISEDRINESVNRILANKSSLSSLSTLNINRLNELSAEIAEIKSQIKNLEEASLA